MGLAISGLAGTPPLAGLLDAPVSKNPYLRSEAVAVTARVLLSSVLFIA